MIYLEILAYISGISVVLLLGLVFYNKFTEIDNNESSEPEDLLLKRIYERKIQIEVDDKASEELKSFLNRPILKPYQYNPTGTIYQPSYLPFGTAFNPTGTSYRDFAYVTDNSAQLKVNFNKYECIYCGNEYDKKPNKCDGCNSKKFKEIE